MGERQDKLVRMFRSDSKIMLSTLSSAISELDGGERSPELVDRAFRAAHSIKSEAGFLHLSEVAESAHRLEDSLAVLRSPGTTIAESAELRRELAVLSDLISDYLATVTEPTHESMSAALKGATGSPQAAAVESELHASGRSMLREAQLRGEELYRIVVRIESPAELRYPRAFLVVNNLELSCALISMEPSLSEVQQGGPSILTLLVTTQSGDVAIRKAVAVDEVELVELTRLSFDELLRPQSDDAARPVEAPDGAEVVALDADLREELGLLADEISRLSAMLSDLDLSQESARREAHTLATGMDRLCRVLRERVDWSSRVQLMDVFRELRKNAVSYAARQGKRIRFDVGGNGAVVFGPVADTLAEAVLHLVRNAIDHGIGTIEERVTMGKPPAGRIVIRVDRVVDNVRVLVEDDGVGVDEERVRQISGDRETRLSDILLAPGFTTRTSAGEGSGRGVGLDSARHAVGDLLSGSLDIRNRAGKGVTVDIEVPLRNRLTRVLVVQTPEGAAAVPAALVASRERIDLRRVKRDSFSLLYYDYKGTSVPVVTPTGENPALDTLRGDSTGLIVRAGVRNYLLIVDSIVGEESVVRDFRSSRRVFSKTLGSEAVFVFPPSLAK